MEVTRRHKSTSIPSEAVPGMLQPSCGHSLKQNVAYLASCSELIVLKEGRRRSGLHSAVQQDTDGIISRTTKRNLFESPLGYCHCDRETIFRSNKILPMGCKFVVLTNYTTRVYTYCAFTLTDMLNYNFIHI